MCFFVSVWGYYEVIWCGEGASRKPSIVVVAVDLYVVIGGRRPILTEYLSSITSVVSRVVVISANSASHAGRVTTRCADQVCSFA